MFIANVFLNEANIDSSLYFSIESQYKSLVLGMTSTLNIKSTISNNRDTLNEQC